MMKLKRKYFSASRIIIFGFACAILFGTIMLMLPGSSRSEGSAPFSDALFTAVSAVCVTGLVVQDTASYWTGFGQGIILLLIQIGGLGIVTVAVAIVILSGKKIGLVQRSTLQEAISAPKVGGIIKLTNFILKITFIIELLGAALMAPIFVKDFGPKGIWMAIFHSVSAYCNAGVDLIGLSAPYSSLTRYAANPLINIVIMCLIITGGIGFLVWNEVKMYRFKLKRYSLQSKIVFSTTVFLIIIPALCFYFGEFYGTAGMKRVWFSLFQSVTARTAGFNTADLSSFGPVGKTIMIIIMLIGGSPGSTAGGMKTTTAAVLVFSAISVFRKKNDAECFGRRISENIVKNAAAIILMYILLFLFGGLIICSVENLPLDVCLFETASAIGTVGLTLGITPQLSGISRIVLMALMYFGRVGGLTILFAAFSAPHTNVSKKPLERITVG